MTETMSPGMACLLTIALSFSCATGAAKPKAAVPKQRISDAVPERVAATREASGVGEPEASEERFATEAARARREQQKIRDTERLRQVDVVDPKAKTPQ